MKVQKINLGETGLFSPLFLDFLDQKESIKPFYSLFPSSENFGKQIQQKGISFPEHYREVLHDAIKKQYEGFDISESVNRNIQKLKEKNTFTVTTGHQLNIFTGPLYFIYKIVTVINACKELSGKYPEYHFVPVYWMASEDHDFEEISYIHLDGHKYTWDTDQKGAVGRFDPSSLKSVLDQIPGTNEIFRKAYLYHESLSSAVRYYVNELFGDEGLVVLDGDDHELKSLFSEILKKEITDQVSFKLVTEDTEKLEALGYKAQISPREINLFYLDNGVRERIIEEKGLYKVLNTGLEFTREDILALVEKEPEKFSPNVILRPLFQEVILPNLAYVGGPAEVIYWLQLKSMFEYFKIPFPILLPRNFVIYITQNISRKIAKTGLKVGEIFEPVGAQLEKFVRQFSENDLELLKESESIENIFKEILKKAIRIDKTLEPLVKAETRKTLNSLEKIEEKMIKAEKRRLDNQTQQIEKINKELFPSGGPQERVLNFLNFQLADNDFLNKIKSSLSPFDIKYHVIIDGSE